MSSGSNSATDHYEVMGRTMFKYGNTCFITSFICYEQILLSNEFVYEEPFRTLKQCFEVRQRAN